MKVKDFFECESVPESRLTFRSAFRHNRRKPHNMSRMPEQSNQPRRILVHDRGETQKAPPVLDGQKIQQNEGIPP